MKQTLLVFLVALSLLSSPFSVSAKSSATDGRLGGKQATFEKRFGANTGQDEIVSGIGYSSNGYGTLVVKYSSGVGVVITLAPVRASHAASNEFDAADWDQAQYEHVVGKFLPSDAKIIGLARLTGDGRQEGACHSDSLGATFSKATWKKLHEGGSLGDCHFLMSPDANGYIYQIEIGLGQSSSLNNAIAPTPQSPTTQTDAAPAAQATQPTASQASGFSADEQAYLDAIGPIIQSVGGALGVVSAETNAADIFGTDWKIRVVVQLLKIQQGYQDFSAIIPPPIFQESYDLTLAGLSDYNDSTYDFANGIDNFDPDLIQKSANEILAGNDLINQATDALNRERASRGSGS